MREFIYSVCLVTTSLFVGQTAGAQGISAGLRGGMSFGMDITQLGEGISGMIWQKEVFARYETPKRFAFELSGTQYNASEAGIWHHSGCVVDYEPIDFFAPPTHENIHTYTNYNMLDLSLGAQYDLSCLLQENCPVRKVFSSYMGVMAIGTFGNTTTYSTDRRLSDGQVNITERTGKGMYNMFLGLNNTATYSINKFYITSVVAYVLSPFDSTHGFHNPANPNSKLLIKLGVGLRF